MKPLCVMTRCPVFRTATAISFSPILMTPSCVAWGSALFQRASTAFLAISLRRSALKAAALAMPPFARPVTSSSSMELSPYVHRQCKNILAIKECKYILTVCTWICRNANAPPFFSRGWGVFLSAARGSSSGKDAEVTSARPIPGGRVLAPFHPGWSLLNKTGNERVTLLTNKPPVNKRRLHRIARPAGCIRAII